MLHDKARSAGFVLPPWMAGARVEALTKNEASMSRLSDGGHAGLSRPSIASEALGLLPGEMQEHFPAVPGWRDKLKAKEHFSAVPGWRDKLKEEAVAAHRFCARACTALCCSTRTETLLHLK